MSTIISLQQILFAYEEQNSYHCHDFSIAKAAHSFIHGVSGSGKSTLLKLLAGTLRPSQGSVEILGQDITKLSARNRDRFRGNHMGMIFQQFNLLPFATVSENIALALNFAPLRKAKVKNFNTEMMALLDALSLEPSRYAHMPAHKLSVGQQQRVAVARALIGAPELIIADEPTSALDEATSHAFMELTLKLAKEQNSTLIMVSHNAQLQSYFAHIHPITSIMQQQENML